MEIHERVAPLQKRSLCVIGMPSVNWAQLGAVFSVACCSLHDDPLAGFVLGLWFRFSDALVPFCLMGSSFVFNGYGFVHRTGSRVNGTNI